MLSNFDFVKITNIHTGITQEGYLVDLDALTGTLVNEHGNTAFTPEIHYIEVIAHGSKPVAIAACDRKPILGIGPQDADQ